MSQPNNPNRNPHKIYGILSFVLGCFFLLPFIALKDELDVSLIPVLLIACLCFFNTYALFTQKPYARKLSLIMGILWAILSIYSIFQGTISLMTFFISYLFISYGRGKELSHHIFNGKEFSKESKRNYLLLIGILGGTVLLLFYFASRP